MFAPRLAGHMNCLLSNIPRASTRATLGLAFLPRPNLRSAATAAKPRAKKTVQRNEELNSVPKKSLSTKSASASANKPTRKKVAGSVGVEGRSDIPSPPGTTKKNTRSASTQSASTAGRPSRATATSSKKATTEAKVPSAPKGKLATPGTVKTAPPVPTTDTAPPRPNAAEPLQSPATATAPAKPAATPIRPPTSPLLTGARSRVTPDRSGRPPVVGPDSPKISPSSLEYQNASRKVTSVIVALPILLVTSYFLFDRLAMGNQPKNLSGFRPETESTIVDTEGGTSQ